MVEATYLPEPVCCGSPDPPFTSINLFAVHWVSVDKLTHRILNSGAGLCDVSFPSLSLILSVQAGALKVCRSRVQAPGPQDRCGDTSHFALQIALGIEVDGRNATSPNLKPKPLGSEKMRTENVQCAGRGGCYVNVSAESLPPQKHFPLVTKHFKGSIYQIS